MARKAKTGRLNQANVPVDAATAVPTDAELRAIVRGADALVMRAGRTLLALILKGSRAQSVVERGWDRLPCYGALRHLAIKAIRRRVDWAIAQGYLQLERARGADLLCLGPAGWELDRQIYVEEILRDFAAKAAEPFQLGDYMYLQEINPEILAQVCDEVRRRRRVALVPVLRAWRGFAAPPVQRRIDRVLHALAPEA
ncbi:MAG: RQC-minor-1 family DNA-binding protein [Planctomycetota bacterium]|jgi:hypothetical protein